MIEALPLSRRSPQPLSTRSGQSALCCAALPRRSKRFSDFRIIPQPLSNFEPILSALPASFFRQRNPPELSRPFESKICVFSRKNALSDACNHIRLPLRRPRRMSPLLLFLAFPVNSWAATPPLRFHLVLKRANLSQPTLKKSNGVRIGRPSRQEQYCLVLQRHFNLAAQVQRTLSRQLYSVFSQSTE